MRLLLASSSPYRLALLKRFGLNFEAIPTGVDEDELKLTGPKELEDLAPYLARAKALAVADLHPEALVIGGDQIAECAGRRLDKPGTREAARAQLAFLSGRTHRLITALYVRQNKRGFTDTVVTEITFRDLTPDLIDAYLELDQPFDCAGSYKTERAGLALIASVRGADPSAIEGLSLTSLVRALNNFNLNLPQLWSLS